MVKEIPEGYTRLTLSDGFTIDVPEDKVNDKEVLDKMRIVADKEIQQVDEQVLKDFETGEKKFVTEKTMRVNDVKTHSDAIRECFGIEKKWVT